MAQPTGTYRHGELWVRCQACGDSDRRPDYGHMSINIRKGVWRCVKCGEAGILTIAQTFDLAQRYGKAVDQNDQPDRKTFTGFRASPGAKIDRFSLLERWHEDDHDAFEIRDASSGEAIGTYLRSIDGRSTIVGESGYGYVGSGSLVSTPRQPLRLVEGPYDVLKPRDVCVYGFLTTRALKRLRWHYVWLCPDGDVWQNEQLRDRFLSVVKTALSPGYSGAYLLGVEMLMNGVDPDEATDDDRRTVDRSTLISWAAKRVSL